MPRLFITDDWPDSLALLARELEDAGFSTACFSSGSELLERLRSERPDLLLIDVQMPGMSGLDVLRALPSVAPGVPAILMTGIEENLTDITVEAIKLHAENFIVKSAPLETVLEKIRSVLEAHRGAAQGERSSDEMLLRFGFVGAAPAMQRLCSLIETIAPTSRPVLLVGDTGTGKELVARALHRLSERASQVFLAVNCGAIVDSLAESELFGHVRGAFTGAATGRDGMFTLAGRGTLFLDEISESTPAIQIKLLRALDPGEFSPVGGLPQAVTTRVICSTNRALGALEHSTFRRDLLYRLESGMIRVPPLSERREDIPPLAVHFLHLEKQQSGEPPFEISPDALDLLAHMTWEGNVRELKGFIGRLLMFTHEDVITPRHIGMLTRERFAQEQHAGSETVDLETFLFQFRDEIRALGADAFLTRVQASMYQRVLAECGGNKSEAARLLKLDPSTFRKALERLL